MTADGEIRIANACTNPDLFWALKGGGGGSFGVVSKLTLGVRELPEFAGGASSSQGLVRRRVPSSDPSVPALLRDNSLQRSLGRAGALRTGQLLEIHGLPRSDVPRRPDESGSRSSNGSLAACRLHAQRSAPHRQHARRHWWDPHGASSNIPTPSSRIRAPARAGRRLVVGEGGQVGPFLYGYESLWLPASLLEATRRTVSSRRSSPRPATGRSSFTSTRASPARPRSHRRRPRHCDESRRAGRFRARYHRVRRGSAYPGLPGHEPDLVRPRAKERAAVAVDERPPHARAQRVRMSRRATTSSAAGSNPTGARTIHAAAVKKKYDPDGLFFVHNGVGSEELERRRLHPHLILN